jgi:hypothetical protein
VRALAAVLLALLAFVASGCGDGSEEAATKSQASTEGDGPRVPAATVIAQIRDALDALDQRAGAFDYTAPDALPAAERIAREYAKLATRAHDQQNRGVSEAENELWDAFAAFLDLRVEMADTVVERVSEGDLAGLRAYLEGVREEAVAVEDRFNRANSRYFGLEDDGA